ncbi:MAG: molybdate ABC transporter substrate-binding protein [Oscillospiraceae bacterium]|jgi:molybdate transport system substrate-binding protein|nr:molybdate ABC transporter substrate-binding protein [Oscillospiraceae bacterium]
MQKKSFKKISALILALALVFALVVPAYAADTYNDVKQGDWFYDAIEKWSGEAAGVIKGYGNGQFGPDDAILDLDLDIIIARVLGGTEPTWQDSPALTREVAIARIAKALAIAPVAEPAAPFADDATIGANYKALIYGIQARGFVNGKENNNFDPRGDFTRAEVVQIIYKALSEITDKDVTGKTYDAGLVVRKAGLTVKDTTVKSDLIIGQGVGSGDATLDGVTVNGSLVLLGGSDGVNLRNGKLDSVVSAKSGKDIVSLKAESTASVGTLTVSAGTAVTVTGSVGEIILEQGSAATVAGGTVAKVTASGASSKLQVLKDATVSAVTISANNVSVYGDGKVTAATVTDSAKNGVTVLTAGTKITTATGAGKVETETVELIVFAAASMTETLNEIAKLYKDVAPTVKLVYTFDSSGTLLTQIQEGAECDVFISAAQKQMNTLADADGVNTATRFNLVENTVALVVPKGNPAGIHSYQDAIDKAESIAIGNSDVPVGQYTEEIFKSLGVWDDILAKASLGTNVKEVTSWVSAGAVDCGIVYGTDAYSAGLEVVAAPPAGSLKTPVVYPAAVLANAQQTAAAQAYLAYLKGAEATAVFESVGFSKP